MTLTNDATQQWSELTTHMEALLSAWETQSTPPALREFLPQGNLALQVVAVVELIKIDLEQRHSRGLWHPLEWYAEKFPEMLHAGEPPCDLIYEEFHVRKSAGDEVDPQEYFQRFPNNRESLARLLNCCDVHQQTTSLAAGRPREAFQPGDQLDDFDLLTRLGSGAFANVFLARQRSMQRIVALKISADKGTEGQTLAQLDHPHIVRVYDQRRLPERKLRLLYMQYAPGGSLQDVVYRVRRTPPQDRTGKILVEAVDESLDRAGYAPPESSAHRRRLAVSGWPETVCRIGIQLAQALDYAHHRGILHRDVKPANVLVTADCTAKLADFNISFSSQLEGASPAAYFGGSLAYMSPEQLEACNPDHDRQPDTLDGRADLFSLAAMLWELLYGVRAYREENLTGAWAATLEELTKRRRNEAPAPPESAQQTELVRSMTEILKRALSPDPEGRPMSGSQLARQLALCLQPKSKQLLEVPRGGLRRWARAWPLTAAMLVILLPNAFAGVFNFIYNKVTIIEKLAHDSKIANADELFNTTCAWLNLIYFSVGALLVYFIMGQAARKILSGRSDLNKVAAVRQRSLYYGHIAAVLGTLMWLSSGIVFPGVMRLQIPDINYWHFLTFFASMAICGLIAAAYPYFLMTFLVTQVYFPALMSQAPVSEEEEGRLQSVPSYFWIYLFISVLVPFAGIALFLLGGVDLKATTPQANWHKAALGALIISGIFGSLAILRLSTWIQNDVKALSAAIHPLDVTSSMTETADALSSTV
jgi:serine/threonine protein kinase